MRPELIVALAAAGLAIGPVLRAVAVRLSVAPGAAGAPVLPGL